jgi:hypothetical protein
MPVPDRLEESQAVPAILREQFRALLTRHPLEDVVLIRVLIEHYNEIAKRANNGDLADARRDYEALWARVPLPSDREVHVILKSFGLPVSALIYWRGGENAAARNELRGALAACAELVSSYRHTFVTCRQLHLANNYVRVLLSEADVAQARELLDNLCAVNNGDANRWPFVGKETLALPLIGDWRQAIEGQLADLDSRLVQLS